MDVPFWSMFVSICQTVLVPVIVGVLVRLVASRLVDRIAPVLPWLASIAIAYIVAIVVAGSAGSIASAGILVLLAVITHNLLGLGVGYGVATACRLDTPTRRALAFEVGLQNSGLASTLATTYFSPLAAAPARSSACGTTSPVPSSPRSSPACPTASRPPRRPSSPARRSRREPPSTSTRGLQARRSTPVGIRRNRPAHDRYRRSALHGQAHERGRESGARLAQLTTDRSRADAHRFYERLGYTASHEGLKLDLGLTST